MEAKLRGTSHNLYGPAVSDLKAAGKKSLEWDLNDWKWDGDLFTATQLNSVQSECRSSQLFPILPETPVSGGLFNGSASGSANNELGNEKGNRELEKRRRVVVAEDEAGSLNLKLGGQAYPIMDEDAKNWKKKMKFIGIASNRAVCQVEDCRADLSDAKGYHRRHKVCAVHSKASKALVGNVLQRFCQQCSRFHLLQEFDEGKRSCRRRLAGHNKRRRKTHPENVVNGSSSNDEQGSNYLLTTLLRILSNLHSNTSDQVKDQDLLSHLLRNLANLSGTNNGGSITGLRQGSQRSVNAETTIGTLGKAPDMIRNDPESAGPSSAFKKNDSIDSYDIVRPSGQCWSVPVSDFTQKRIFINNAQDVTPQPSSSPQSTALFPSICNLSVKVNEPQDAVGRITYNNFDLNNVYDGSQDCVGNPERSPAPLHTGMGSITCPLWVKSDFHKKGPLQMSGNSDSTSYQTPSSSGGEAQSRTYRIVFKLFGKDPNDFPVAMRAQILDWLSHSPSDIESYIRPGCIVLTIYLRLGKPQWEEICLDLGTSLSRLLDVSTDSFWRSGWVYARVQHCVCFIYNGKVVLDAPLPLQSNRSCKILSIKPLAVTLSGRAYFVVKGFNIVRPATRLLCALEGKYLTQQTSYDFVEVADSTNEHGKLQSLSFRCWIPNITGRGFIEVEDHGLSSSFFPFIVAEQDVCSEICMLEEAIEAAETADQMPKNPVRLEAKNQALDFTHEMGWLLHRSHSKVRPGHLDPNSNLFPLKRYKWLLEFSMDHDWCAVVKKLLNILFDGTVDTQEYSSIELALSHMALLHRAVLRNCRSMVEFLLRYIPDKQARLKQKQEIDGAYINFIFKPDIVGPDGLTPLHIAASRDGSENVLDSLTDDPGSVGIKAWRTSRDNTGLTPNDYACLRGYHSYIHLIQRKTDKKAENAQVILDIPRTLLDHDTKHKNEHKLTKIASLEIEKMKMNRMQQQCKLCEQKLIFRQRTTMVHRPAMLSMVVVAAVCVCMALLFKSSPEVVYVFQPFRWELIKYGSS